MADLVVTATTVLKGTGMTVQTGTAGEAITAGQPIFRDTATGATNGQFLKCDNNDNLRNFACDGIALNSPAAGQPISYGSGGEYNPGATVAVGTAYYVSSNPGGICVETDLLTGMKVIFIGVATATNKLKLNIFVPAATKP